MKMPGINSQPDWAVNYRGLFLAKITAVDTPDDGTLEGLHVYSFIEQNWDPSTGTPIDAQPARVGTYDPLSSPALEPNNALLTVDAFVYMRQSGSIFGQTFYEVIGGAGGSTRSYIVKLTGQGAGIDGGTAWAGLIQKEVDGAVVDNGTIGTVAEPYVMYKTLADDGNPGNPEIGDLVVAVPDPLLPGRYEFIPKIDNEVMCGDCCWFADMSLEACLLIKQLGGAGKCACNPADAGDGTPAVYMADFGGWLALKMGTTCCGCGGMVFKITDPEECKAVLELHRYHVSCAGGSGGAVFTKNLYLSCCGREKMPDGSIVPFAIFVGFGNDPCENIDPIGCDNAFRIKVSCGTCPDTDCTCTKCLACCSGATPYGWYLDESDFANENQNGLWILETQVDVPCHWTGSCEPGLGGGGLSDLTVYEDVDGFGDPIDVWKLDHLGTIYETESWNCCDANVMTKVSGEGPATITLHPITLNGECPVCEPTWPATVYLEILELELIDGGNGLPCTPRYEGEIIVLTQQGGVDNPYWWNHAPSEMAPCCNPGFGDQGGNVAFACQDEILGCRGFNAQFSGPECGVQVFDLIDCQCPIGGEALYYEGEGIYTNVTSTGDCCGPADSQIRMRIRVTE